MIDWEAEIETAALVHSRIEELDSRRLWQRHLPNVGAKPHEIAAAEASIGFGLDRNYRSFLEKADGWSCFYQYVDLLGTSALRGEPPMDVVRRQLGAIGPDAFRDLVGTDVSDVLPIGGSSVQRDMFFLVRPSVPGSGNIVWLSGGVVDRFSTFTEFFLSMVDYNRHEVDDLLREASS